MMRERRRMLNESALVLHNIEVIRNFVVNGGDLRDDPDILKEFYILVDEFGVEIFQHELEMLHLTYEDGTLKEIEDKDKEA